MLLHRLVLCCAVSFLLSVSSSFAVVSDTQRLKADTLLLAEPSLSDRFVGSDFSYLFSRPLRSDLSAITGDYSLYNRPFTFNAWSFSGMASPMSAVTMLRSQVFAKTDATIAGCNCPPPFTGVSGYNDPGLKGNPVTWRTDEFNADWGLSSIKAEYAYARGFTGRGVKLGVLDTGTWRDHPEFSAPDKLVALITTGIRIDGDYDNPDDPGAKPGNPFIVDGGIPAYGLVYRYPVEARNKFGYEFNSHGTHTGGTIAAQRDGKGMHGVAFDSQLFAAGVGGFDDGVMIAGFKELAAKGVLAINNSWGGGALWGRSVVLQRDDGSYVGYRDLKIQRKFWLYDDKGVAVTHKYYLMAGMPELYEAIADTAKKGVITVFAAGNSFNSAASPTSNIPYMFLDKQVEDHFVSVVALDNKTGKQEKSYFSSICARTKFYCISTPGSVVSSAVADGPEGPDVKPSDIVKLKPGYANYNGTSMAAPHVVGSLGIIKQRYPYMTSAQVTNTMFTTADHLAYNPDDLDVRKVGSVPDADNPARSLSVYRASDFGVKYWLDNNCSTCRIPNEVFGWGLANLKRAMDGPGQLLGNEKYNLPAGTYDVWKNDISDEAVRAYKDFYKQQTEYAIKAFKDKRSTDSMLARALAYTKLTKAELEANLAKGLDEFTMAREREYNTRQWFGSLVKTGYGVLSLQNENHYTGSTTVIQGVLDFRGRDGGFASSGFVKNDVIVSGTGILTGNLKAGANMMVEQSGVVRPGDYIVNKDNKTMSDLYQGGSGDLKIVPHIGEIMVAGDYKQSGTSTYVADINPDANTADRINVIGKAFLSGNAMISANGLNYKLLGKRYTILRSLAGIEGRYSSLVNPRLSLFTDASLFYDSSNVYVGVSRARDFATVAATSNERNTANGLQSLSGGDGYYNGNNAYNAFAMLPDHASARRALNMLSGEVHTSMVSAMLVDSSIVRETAFNRSNVVLPIRTVVAALKGKKQSGTKSVIMSYASVKGVQAAQSDAKGKSAGNVIAINHGWLSGFEVWLSGVGNWSEIDGDGNGYKTKSRSSGLMAGIDRTFVSATPVRVGIVAGYSRGSVDGRHGSGDIDNYHFGIYGGVRFGSVSLRGGAFYTRHDIDVNRNVAYNGFSDRLRSSYNGHTAQGFMDVGYDIMVKPEFIVTPFARLAYVNTRTGSFRENGGVAALTGMSMSEDLSSGTVGVRGAYAFGSLGKGLYRLEAMAGWRHRFNRVRPSASMKFAGGDAFRVDGAGFDRDAFVGRVDFSGVIGGNKKFNIGYSGEFGKNSRNNRINAGISVLF